LLLPNSGARERVPEHQLNATLRNAEATTTHYGYWVYDPVYDYYYWFTADVVIVDASWVPYP